MALNCVGNGRLLREGPFTGIWIQPAAGDAGGASGAALAAWHQREEQPRTRNGTRDAMQGSFLGPSYTNEEGPRYVQTIYDHLLDLKADGTFRLNMD